MSFRRPSGDSSDPGVPADGRLILYRRAARLLNGFCGRWTAAFCAGCLEVTALHHRGDPRADVELLAGVFPGCCHAGVADALWVPGTGEEGRFPPEMARAATYARGTSAASFGEPPTYKVRERQSGLESTGVACAHLGPDGCRLGELKAPLCLCYVCEPILEALALGQALGSTANVEAVDALAVDTDDFAGTRAVLRAVVSGPLPEAEAEVSALEDRLAALERILGERAGSGAMLLALWRQRRTAPVAAPGGKDSRTERRSGGP